jgi:hypothetical protein
MADTQNSTAITATPDQQSQETPIAPSDSPLSSIATPLPTQAPDPQAVVDNPTQDLSNKLDTSNGVGAAPDQSPAQQADAQAAMQTQLAVNSGNAAPNATAPLIPSAPLVAAPDGSTTTPGAVAVKPAPKSFVQKLLATSAEIFKAMAGGDQYTTTIDANGVATRTPVKMDKTHLGLAIALEALSGGLAGAGAHGTAATGEAAAAGLQQGEKIADQRRQTQEVADQKAQQDYVRKFESTKAALATYQGMQAIGKQDYDIANAPVPNNQKRLAFWEQHNPEKVGDPDVAEADLPEALKKHPITDYFPMAIATEPKIDPKTGEEAWQDAHGRTVPPGTPWAHKQYVHRYALIHRDADADTHDEEGNLAADMADQVAWGVTKPDIAQTGQTTSVPAAGNATNNAEVLVRKGFDGLVNGKNGILAQINNYRHLVDGKPENASPSAVDPSTSSVYDLFGGNTSKMADFIKSQEGNKVQANGQPTRAMRDKNPGMLVADASWTGPVDKENLAPGQAPYRVYQTDQQGSDALDQQIAAWQKANPNESIQSFFSKYTTPGVVGKDGLNDQQRYIKAALLQNSATNINDSSDTIKPFDTQAWLKSDPDNARAIKEFNRSFYASGDPKTGTKGNPKASLQVALNNMPNANLRARIINGPLGGDQTAGVDYDAARNNQAAAIMGQTRNEAKLNFERDKREQERKVAISSNEHTIQAILNGSAIDLRGVLTMRGFERGAVTDELVRRSNGRYSAASIDQMIKLNDEINNPDKQGSYGNKVQGYNTAFQHTEEADRLLHILQTQLPPGVDKTAIFNQPMADVAKYFTGISPQAAATFTQYQEALQTATGDWQNAIHNQRAVHEGEERAAKEAVSPISNPALGHAALVEMARTQAGRMEPLNDQYRQTMSTQTYTDSSGVTHQGQQLDFPNLLTPQSVAAIRNLGDPRVMQAVAHFQSGGQTTGGKNGLGVPGKEAGLMLTPAAPTQGAQPTMSIIQQFANVYTQPADLKRALAANGWATK